MPTQEENELIAEKLLGWKRKEWRTTLTDAMPGFSHVDTNGQLVSVPRFTSWASAGLILEALALAVTGVLELLTDGRKWTLQVQFGLDVSAVVYGFGNTAPAAIRAAALAYLGAQK